MDGEGSEAILDFEFWMMEEECRRAERGTDE